MKKQKHIRRSSPPHPARTVLPDPVDQLANDLRWVVAAYEKRVATPCEPGCPCSLSRVVGAARVFLDDYDRFVRGEFLTVGIPFGDK